MPTRDEIIRLLVEQCESELNYYDVVNECAEEIDFQLIVEFILQNVFDVWRGENAN